MKLSPLALILMSVMMTASAQEDAADPEPQSAGDGKAVERANAAATDTPPPGATPAPNSPFDYEASEQISEDLSVSFPVDI